MLQIRSGSRKQMRVRQILYAKGDLQMFYVAEMER